MKKSTLLYAGLTWVVMMLFSGIVSAACDQEFYWTLRYNKQYTFGDDFNAGSSDKWIKKANGAFSEQIDYNGWDNPGFDWTDDIRNAKGKVPAWTTMSVLKAKSPYPIRYVPVSRSYDNLLITYTIQYSTDSAWNNQYTHTECKHYEISRCGDGVVDSSYWEKCDPKDTSKTWWWNGWCDNSCNPVTAEQPVCNSTYNGQRLSNLTESASLCTKWTVSDFKYNESTHKWTWKCNNVAWQSKECSATKPYCGDWTKDAWETCDPKDPNKTWWWNGWCDNSCNPITIGEPVCNSSYNGQRVTSLVEWNYLCTEWTVSEFKYNESTHKWTWKCNNTLWKSRECSATKPYCGDWTKDAWEICDPKDPNKTWWWNGWCDNSCNPITIGEPVCNSSYNGQRVTSLVEWNYLCTEWTVSEFKYNESTHKWTWKCNNTLWKSRECSATKPYCGDWTKDAWETCDPKDPNKTWWGEEWCSESCEAVSSRCGDGKKNWNEECDPKDPNKEWWSDLWCDASCHQITVPSGCDETFYETLRYGHKYTFYDDFHANVGDKWLWNWVMEYEEQYDYNKSPDFPQFAWTTDLVNANYRVASNTTMRVLQATSAYPILAVPAQRAFDNLFIKYTLTYSTDSAWNNKYAHSECAYYEISRCGDGVLDTEYDEICDPKDPNHQWWWNGWCDDTCNPITVVEPDWKLKIEKTLVWSKEVKNTWDIITWNVKVTAEDGDVTNFIVTDKLPDILEYDSYTVTHNPWLTVGKPTVNWNNIEWRVTWTLKEWEYLEIQLKTKAKWMPKEDIVNVACVRPEDKPEEDCDEDDIPVGWKLKIEKTLVWSKEVKNTWDIITWNIKVTAEDGDVTNFIITDKLPEILWYSGYEIVHTWSVDTITFGWENKAQNSVSWTVKWTLKENDYVEITLITYAKVMPDKDYKNVACVAPEDNPKDEKCDDEELPSPHIRIKKSFTDWSKTKTVKIWDEIGYKITFGNTGNASATITSIKDFLPKNVEYVTGTIFLDGQSNHENTTWGEIIDILRWTHFNKTVDGVYIDIYTWITLKPGESWYIILTGKVLTWNQDSRTNFACIYLNDKKVDCDDATHDLWQDMCEKLDVPAWNLPSGWGSKDVTCTTVSGAVAEYIEIDCGDGASGNRYITWSNIKSLTGTCSYPSGSKTYNLACKVKVEWKEYSSNACKWTVTVSSPGGWGGNPPTSPSWWGGRRPTTDYCETHKESVECNLADEHCFNVNAWNFSIEKTELLPVYLNVYREKESGYKYKYTSNEDCNPGEVNLASLKCKIRILRPDNNEVAYTSNEFDCLTLGDDVFTSNKNPLIKSRAEKQTELYEIKPFESGAWKYRPTIMVISWNQLNTINSKREEILWEYKFQIMVTKYDQCEVDSSWNGKWWETITREDAAVCQSNFVLTDSYTVQKTPSGNLTASTDTLEKFKEVDGKSVRSFSSYLNAIATSEYHPNDTVNKAMDAFINKYKKLAVKVDISRSKFLSSDVEVKKVPGKHIYFVNGDITVKWWSKNIETPFTIVQTSGKTIISGDVSHNMMLLTRWNITFEWDCTTNQDVKWIFYAQWNLNREWVSKNNNINNTVRCTQWWLNIKWVLIWNNFKNLMKDSRSHLEGWFEASNKTTEVMNWWSVVIEYSPSIFTKGTMPPGAEDFTTALSIYKN